MKDPSFRFCAVCQKRTVHRKKRMLRRDVVPYAWVCATCDPREKGEGR